MATQPQAAPKEPRRINIQPHRLGMGWHYLWEYDPPVEHVVKSEDGSGRFETITDPDEVIKLAGRPGRFDLHEEYGVPEKLVEALDITTQLAMAAGLDALREAARAGRRLERAAPLRQRTPAVVGQLERIRRGDENVPPQHRRDQQVQPSRERKRDELKRDRDRKGLTEDRGRLVLAPSARMADGVHLPVSVEHLPHRKQRPSLDRDRIGIYHIKLSAVPTRDTGVACLSYERQPLTIGRPCGCHAKTREGQVFGTP